jgi:EF hand
MSDGSKSWMWLTSAALLLGATGVGLYLSHSPAQANEEAQLPFSPPTALSSGSAQRSTIAEESETPRTAEDKRLARLDKNDNFLVEIEEYLASRRKAYDKLDTDADGKLSFEEYALKTTQKFEAADANRNGKLEPAEFATTARPPAKKKCDCQPVDDKD